MIRALPVRFVRPGWPQGFAREDGPCMREQRIQPLIDAISEGEPIDWTVVRHRLRDRSNATDCENLETLSKIGRPPRDGFLEVLGKQTYVATALAPLRRFVRLVREA